MQYFAIHIKNTITGEKYIKRLMAETFNQAVLLANQLANKDEIVYMVDGEVL